VNEELAGLAGRVGHRGSGIGRIGTAQEAGQPMAARPRLLRSCGGGDSIAAMHRRPPRRARLPAPPASFAAGCRRQAARRLSLRDFLP
jgi:hypothetical protein